MGQLFPAYAGVIPSQYFIFCISRTFPRTRGGDPNYYELGQPKPFLFPAHAGVILVYSEKL